jgi:trehalose 6-phosphate synthase
MAWTKERLEEITRERLGGAKLIVVANREPYIHVHEGDDIHCMIPASGLTTALDPVMRVCHGTWVGHGSGDADREKTDENGRIAVPPEKPSYTLRRVWLTRDQEQGFYYGFANDALWPLCHIAYQRPQFDPNNWEQYKAVNQLFAQAVLQEVDDHPAVVFVQDYHFALLPRLVKQAKPHLIVLQFWHIPWPNREAFRVCPWKEEILNGLLGNDILSFHIQHHCNNFLDSVDRLIEAKVDMEHFSVTCGGKTTLVRPQPISIDPETADTLLSGFTPPQERQLRRQFKLGNQAILLGVDRVDYTKGIPERIRAIDRLLVRHPEVKGKFCFLQIGAPSRIHIPAYRRLNDEIEALVEEINWRHATGTWKPMVFRNEHHGPETLYRLYRMATGCVVSSLHDGMNLVAKEYVAARGDLRGVLVLSRFTGAARELAEAVQVNPYDVDGFADALHLALTMTEVEQERRMSLLRDRVVDNNIYRWAGMLLSEAAKLVKAGKGSEPSAVGNSAPATSQPTT